MITILMPTISGREESCEQMKQFFRERSSGNELQFLCPLDHPNWAAGVNAAAADVEGDYIFYAADDLEPLPGWADAMISCLERGEVPAPRIWNHIREGSPVNEDEDGKSGELTAFSRSPALTRQMMLEVGVWPEIQYFSDNWVSDKARSLGYGIRVTAGYEFIHHWHPVGRLDGGDWIGRDYPVYLKARAQIAP